MDENNRYRVNIKAFYQPPPYIIRSVLINYLRDTNYHTSIGTIWWLKSWLFPVQRTAIATSVLEHMKDHGILTLIYEMPQSLVSFILANTGLIPPGLEIALYIIAIPIGAYHWTREGLENLIEEHVIGIEILMIAATIGSAVLGLWDEAAFLVFYMVSLKVRQS